MEVSTLAPTRGGMSSFANSVYKDKYAMKFEDGTSEEWPDTAARVALNVMAALDYDWDSPETQKIYELIKDRKFMPGGRYLYASGRELHQVQNCLLMRAEDSREGWGEIASNAMRALMTGAGIGVDWSDLREAGALIKKTGGHASGPIAPMKIVNEIGRNVMQGGHRRSAIWAGLNWRHPDIFRFINSKNWTAEVRALKAKDYNFPGDLDMTNISVLLDDNFFRAFQNVDDRDHQLAQDVYWSTVTRMLKTAEPGFSVDIGKNFGETLRNACTEVTSHHDSDICNLGSINLARIESKDDLQEVVKAATLFLIAGTVYSDLPYEKVGMIREKNRRLGLGVMGIHEWLLLRGKRYDIDSELGEWLEIYQESGKWANQYADRHNISRPVKTRAIAPTGTIGIVAETTTGIEPIFCAAYKRRVRTASTKGEDSVRYEYVVDPTARRLLDHGTDPHAVEDAYTLSLDYERRIAFQAWVQQYVDHGISSTINLPDVVTDAKDVRDFGDTLMKYLPYLRGTTVYPDGARPGQPLTPVDLEYALAQEGVVFEESDDKCVGGVCGI